MLCSVLCVTRILAVSDEHIHHRSPYFGIAKKDRLGVSYNEIWTDRGGFPVDVSHYELPLGLQQRSRGCIPSKKRGMYRRRYDMLHSLKQQMKTTYGRLR